MSAPYHLLQEAYTFRIGNQRLAEYDHELAIEAIQPMSTWRRAFAKPVHPLEMLSGGELEESRILLPGDLIARDIRFTKPLSPGDRTTFAYRQCFLPFNGGLATQVQVSISVPVYRLVMTVQFLNKRPRRVWSTQWAGVHPDARIIREHEVELILYDRAWQADRTDQDVELGTHGFRWEW